MESKQLDDGIRDTFVSVGATSGLQHIGRQRAPQRFHFVQSSLPPFRTANSVGASSGASRKGRRLMTNATCRISSAPYCIAPNSTFCAHSLDAPCPRDNPEQALNAGVSWHTFRHMVGAILAEMGEHQLTIRDYLRHSNLHVTNKYLQATPESKRLAQGKLVDAILPGGLLSVNKSTLTLIQ